MHHDTQAIASWSYDPTKKLMVSYDTPQNAAAKVEYIRSRRLGGGMWWESSGDKGGEESLINLVRHTLLHMNAMSLADFNRA